VDEAAAAVHAGGMAYDKMRLFERTLVNLRTSFNWAWLDTVCQYRRSKIGPLWETINIAVLVVGLAVVYSGIFGSDTIHLIGYIGLGIIVWSAIASFVTEGCTTFVRNASLILTSNISIDQYVGRTLFKTLITFAHHLAIYVIGLALGFLPLAWINLLALPGLLLLFLNGVWVVALLAFVCARFRDIELIVRNLLQLAFLVTPVFWNYQQIASNRRFVVDYNVFFHFIEIVRAPLLGQAPSPASYAVVLGVTVLGYAAAFVTYRHMRRSLAFFV
jgi:ABC-2 type transport system permease protein/lipopolysaccharide transport system permease protein